MKVKKLISELKKVPGNLEVGVALHDNSENEIAGWVFGVNVINEIDTPEGTMKQTCVSLCC